jgi:hypothetical protein
MEKCRADIVTGEKEFITTGQQSTRFQLNIFKYKIRASRLRIPAMAQHSDSSLVHSTGTLLCHKGAYALVQQRRGEERHSALALQRDPAMAE